MQDTEIRNAAKRARELQKQFEEFYPDWVYGSDNPHLRWVQTRSHLNVEDVVQFFNAWRPLSRHQPQILLLLASAFPEHADRKPFIKRNYLDEDGIEDGMDPHYELLDQLIRKLGGVPAVLPRSEAIMTQFHQDLWRPTTPARSAGLLAGIEAPALEISSFFQEVVSRSGFPELLSTDPYLRIHTVVEFVHIVDTHETALRHIDQGPQQREEVLTAFKEVMSFWCAFWDAAWQDLKAATAPA